MNTLKLHKPFHIGFNSAAARLSSFKNQGDSRKYHLVEDGFFRSWKTGALQCFYCGLYSYSSTVTDIHAYLGSFCAYYLSRRTRHFDIYVPLKCIVCKTNQVSYMMLPCCCLCYCSDCICVNELCMNCNKSVRSAMKVHF